MKDIVRQMIKLPWVRSIVFGIFTAAFVVGSLTGLHQALAATAQNCDTNAVIYCGASSVGDLTSKYSNGDGHNSASSIQHIYSWFGISSSDMQSISSMAQNGTVSSSGDVFVGSNMVASGAMTGGRENISGSTQHTSQGTTFFSRPPSVSFQSSSLDAFVVMKNGVFQFAVLKSCGNPVKATPKTTPPKPQPQPKPTVQPPAQQPATNICNGNTTNTNTNGIASQGGNCSINTTTVVQQAPPVTQPAPTPFGMCGGLLVTANQNDAGPLTVLASVNLSASNGAQLQGIVYNFGDGTVTPSTTQTSMSHTYQQAGTYTISAIVSFNTGANQVMTASASTPDSTATASAASQTTVASSTCQATITVSPAPTPPAPPQPVVTTSTPVQTTAAPQQLVNTGPSSTAAVFGLTTVGSTLAYRFYLRRRLSM